jgi:D-lactate dehydrogenase
MAIDTCAVDGLCATTCPVGIDTGALTKRLRSEAHSPAAQRWSRRVAERYWEVEPLVRTGLRAGHLVARVAGDGAVTALTRGLRRLAGEQTVPLWLPPMPRAGTPQLPPTTREGACAVYVPSCLSRMMGALPGEPDALSLPEALVAIAARAGRPLYVPDSRGVCCGVPFSSKGFTEGHAAAANHAVARCWTWSDEGRLPVVMDTSPCTYGLKTCRPTLDAENRDRFDRLRIMDAIEFVHDTVLPQLTLRPVDRVVAMHPVCSVTKMFLVPRFEAIVRAAARQAFTPPSAGCCGQAGDRGWLLPGLAASATAAEAAEVRAAGADVGAASSRTCEANLARATGLVYRSFVFLVEEASR